MKTIILPACICLSFIACQSHSPETVSQQLPLSDTIQKVEKKEIVFNSMKKEELFAFLPEAKGFNKNGDPSGESAHVGKSGSKYYSYVRQEYIKGQNLYTIEIIDYKDDTATFNGLAKMYKSLNNTADAETRTTRIAGERFIINGMTNNKDKKELEILLAAVPLSKMPKS